MDSSGPAESRRVVVTGASGDVGTALLRARPADWSVIGLARRIPSGPPYQDIQWRRCDLGSARATEVLADTLAGADAVVHLAWAINPTTREPPMERTNDEGTDRVLNAVVAAGVPQVVCLSSVAAYRPPPRWQEVTEDWPCDGVHGSAYSRGKARLERQLTEFAAAHPDIAVTTLRPCAIVSRAAGGQFTRWLLSPLLPGSLVGRRWFPLPLWRELRAQVVHAEDVADALVRVVRGRAGGPFNLAAGPPLNAAQLAEAIGGWRLPVPRTAVLGAAELTARTGVQPVHQGWLRLADQAALADTSRAHRELAWQPAWSAAAALAELAAGIRLGIGTGSAPLAPDPPRGPVARWREINWGGASRQG
ncbi:MAG TPA: NAD-dependent epimerase/dehydratase family protein [Pseudonocardiaceae bacterium]|jgi:nucleoside-diphosphate-sugar epimerase|nr:NAD-dependent epimerase/dehydratase family protein [Pseudonocardiaceae bacterium]